MGTISEKEARLASRKVARTLQKLITSYSAEVCKLDKHFSVQNMRVRHFKVVNFWASTRLPWNVKLLVSRKYLINDPSSLFVIYRALPRSTRSVSMSQNCPLTSPTR